MAELVIEQDDPARDDVANLLDAHAAFALAESPPGTCHFLDSAGLKAPDISFWSLRENSSLLGVVALKTLNDHHGEIKSMHVAQTARRQGVGRRLMNHLMTEARRRGYHSLWLETGNSDGFKAAVTLYYDMGFASCPPFGEYVATDFNIFMRLDLESEDHGSDPKGA